MRERLESGTPAPLGASCRDGGVNFALYSGHAERVELCLFEADGTPGPRFDLPACKARVT